MTRQEKIKKYDVILKKSITNKECVKIFRTICDKEEDISGFILSMSKQFLLIQLDFEFMFNGFAIIRKGDYDKIRCNEWDKTQRKIFKAEGLLETEYGLDKNIPLTSWKNIITALKNYDYHIVIESVQKDYLAFNIGQIIRVSETSVSILYYNPAGRLDKVPTKIKYDAISNVKFGDRYSTIFRKYLKADKRKK